MVLALQDTIYETTFTHPEEGTVHRVSCSELSVK